MKKYLMTGVAALALCAGFTACSHDEDFSFNENEYVESQKALIEAKYQQAFVNAFGQPAKNQTWGFGNYATRAANTNHNEWAAVDNIYKLLVPPALTPGQIQRVKVYFQYNRYLTYEDPHLTNFFVQQVYEGSTDPGALSSEVYTSGNGARVVAGDHMDKLTVGVAETHVNDFNSADCGESDVLNNGTKQNNYVTNGTTHKDKITLMLGESTEYVGFFCSEGSVQHNDCCALAGADVIDAWAASDEAKALGIDLGEAVVDGWDRSFVGLDYEQISPENLFREKYVWPEGNRSEVKVWDFCSDTNNTHKVKLNGKLVDANTVPNNQLFFPNGKPVKWVDDNTNMYLGQNLGTNQNTFNKQENGVKYYDLDAVYACINQGAYPKVNNMEFIKGLGGRDYVFSDWIVTLTPAKKFDVPNEIKVRILCEDMNAGTEKGDFDFNDAVVDLTLDGEDVTTANVTKIEILHTGAQFDIYVDGHEVHAALGLQKGQFGSGYKAFDPSANNLKAADIKIVTHRDFTYTDANGEKKTVKEELELGAPVGKAPAKILVGVDCNAPDERQAIDAKYTSFPTWVQSSEQNRVPFWRNNNDD